MFVSRSMTTTVITVPGETTLHAAQELMAQHHIRHLPVVDGEGRLEGIVSERDLRSALPSSLLEEAEREARKTELFKRPVTDIMTADPVAISGSATIQDALLMIQQHRVGAFPVVGENRMLEGIVSVRDLLRAFINIMGIGEPGTLLCILVEEKVGQLKKIVDAIAEENISMGSVLVARYWDEGKRAVFPYLLTNNVGGIKKKIVALGFELLDPMAWYMDQLPSNE